MDKEQIAKALIGKHILITGGTGSFGKQIVEELLQYEPASIHIYSRDEKKQYDMQQMYLKHEKKMHFILGDVRDLERTREVLRGKDIVFHAAALKQVPNCEFAPYEAVKTNIIGAENIRRAAIEAGVEIVIAISTDKAVKPVNVMGMSKAIQERIMLHPINGENGTRFVCVRYGNVLGSRGSVVPLFHRCILHDEPLPITHPDMTRFLLTLNQAVQLVLWATVKGKGGDLWVRKMPAATVADLGRALAQGMTGRKDYPQKIVGIRPGEKMHEVLISEEEMWRADEMEKHFLISNWLMVQRMQNPTNDVVKEYSSDSVHRMSEIELMILLESEGWFLREAKTGL